MSEAPPPSSNRARAKDGGKEKEVFGCPFPGCGQSYSRMEYLKRHQRKHQDVRPFQCKDCSKSFARSDVLLRHRRRCHPTPPPPDRQSTSPPSLLRPYPGVPVSSSRNDAREASPRRERKHPRSSSGTGYNGQGQRLKLENADDDLEDDEQYPEASAFARHRTEPKVPVFSMNGFFDSGGESSTYTPHLLPMFHNGPQFPNDQDHLEDASVLLSMAYPTGFRSDGEESTTEAQRAIQDIPDWAAGQTINMMMEASGNDPGIGLDRDRSDSAASGSIRSNVSPIIAQGGQTVLTESAGNLLNAMNWLGPAMSKDGMTSNDGAPSGWANVMVASPKPLSPFPLSSLFSPSVFGMPSLPTHDGTDENDVSLSETNQAVLSILDQLAMYDVPETRMTPNPERPLLRLEHNALSGRQGEELSKNSRFYLPADRFASCYQIPHWSLPSLKTLAAIAARTCNSILGHFSFVHMPTFRLIDTSGCLAFAICTVDGIRSGKQRFHYDGLLQRLPDTGAISPKGINTPVAFRSSWDSRYSHTYEKGGKGDEEEREIEAWGNGAIVRREKSNILVQSFVTAEGLLMTDYNVGLLQALIVYHAPYFLSEDQDERSMGNVFLGTIVNIARQIGFFNQDLEHFETEISFPLTPYPPNDLDIHWRHWIELETRRRTAYLIFHLDTVSALESNIPCILSPCDISHMPLPAPDTLWKATTAIEWLRAVRRYRPMTLDEAMRRIFFLPTYGAFDALHERADTKYYNLLNETELGPFARVAMIVCLVRGIMDIGEGKRDRGDWRDLTDLWVGCSWLKPGKKMLDSEGHDIGQVGRETLRQRFASGLEKWRQGWDFDALCPSPAVGTNNSSVSLVSGSLNDVSPQSSGITSDEEAQLKPTKINYCEEALPFYWLAQALLNILDNSPSFEPGWNTFHSSSTGGVNYGEMLKSARMFTRMGEGMGAMAAMMGQSGLTEPGTAV